MRDVDVHRGGAEGAGGERDRPPCVGLEAGECGDAPTTRLRHTTDEDKVFVLEVEAQNAVGEVFPVVEVLVHVGDYVPPGLDKCLLAMLEQQKRPLVIRTLELDAAARSGMSRSAHRCGLGLSCTHTSKNASPCTSTFLIDRLWSIGWVILSVGSLITRFGGLNGT